MADDVHERLRRQILIRQKEGWCYVEEYLSTFRYGSLVVTARALQSLDRGFEPYLAFVVWP